jgi:hypothetical protein
VKKKRGKKPVKNANKKPTLRQIAERVSRIETYLQKVINPNVSATMNMFEQYLDYKNDLIPFTERISEKVDEEIERASTERKEKPTKGSRAPETGGKNGKKLQSGGSQQGQGRRPVRKG